MTRKGWKEVLVRLILALNIILHLLFHNTKIRLWFYDKLAKILMLDEDCLVFTNVRVITGEKFDPMSIDNGVMPLISDQGFILATHGCPDGKVMIRKGDRLAPVRIDDNRFTDIFMPGLDIIVLGCFPGARPESWEHNGRHFINPGHYYAPMFMFITKDQKLVYAPVSWKLAVDMKLM